MQERKPAIPYYKEINDFLAALPSPYRSKNPDFFCLRLQANEVAMSRYKAPFRKDFYFIALVRNAGNTRISYDHTQVSQLKAFLVFQSPGLLYSFQRDPSAEGYLIYFKRECFSFFKPELESEFPFFDPLHSHFFKLNQDRFQAFSPAFESLFLAYEQASEQNHKLASARLLALLYELKNFTRAFEQWEEGFTGPQQKLLQKFLRLINHYYTEKRSVEDYAELLHLSPNHLSQSIKAVSGKNALSFVNERILTEAKSLILYTEFDMAEIAYRLNFSDPANFGKFFKKHSGLSPLEFRKQSATQA